MKFRIKKVAILGRMESLIGWSPQTSCLASGIVMNRPKGDVLTVNQPKDEFDWQVPK